MIGFCSSAVLLVAEQAGSGSRAASHLINAELTGHAAAAAAADSQLPAAPAATGEKKTFSRVTTLHQRGFWISYVINSDLSRRGHHAARRAAGGRALTCPLRSKNYLHPVGVFCFFFDCCLGFRHLRDNCHLSRFNIDTGELKFNMVDLLPIKLSPLIWRWPV